MGRVRLRVSALVLAIACVSISIARAQKTTVDPNTGGAASRVAKRPDADIRLAQKVTYEARHKSLKNILVDFSEQTNVALYAGYNKQDWQVRDRKMIILAKDVPLAALMNSIARVMKFTWSKNDQVRPTTYRLLADRKQIARMVVEQQRKDEALKAEVGRRRQNLVDAIDEVSRMSDAEIEALELENPYLYLTAKNGCAKLTRALFAEIPGLKENFLNSGRNILLPASQLSPETRQLLLDAVKGNWPYRQFQEGTNKPFPDGIEDALDRSNIGVEHIPRPLRGGDGRSQLSFYGGLGLGTPFGFCHIGYWRDPDSSGAQLGSKLFAKGVEEGIPFDDVFADYAQEQADAVAKEANDFEKYALMDPLTEHADAPYLHDKIELKKPEPVKEDENRIPSQVLNHMHCLRSLADATGFCVVSDSFNRLSGGFNSYEKKRQLQDILGLVGTSYDCNWEKHGSVIEFRDRDWFRKRSSQIPDEWVEQWAGSLEEHGSLSLEEFAQICVLDFNQIEENISADPVLRHCVNPIWNLINNKAVLCLYLRLNGEQRRTLFSRFGLDSRALSPEQYQYLIWAFTYGSGIQWDTERFLNGAYRGLTLSAQAVAGENDAVSGYHFAAAIDDGSPPFEWNVTLPTYERPTKRIAPVAE